MKMLSHFHDLPIGKKLQVINLFIVSLIIMLSSINLSYYMFDSVQTDYRIKAKTLSTVLAGSMESALLFNDAKAAQEALASLRSITDVTQAAVYDRSGLLFTRYSSGDVPSTPAARFDPKQYDQAAAWGSITRDFAQPVLSSGSDRERIGTITMQMDLSGAYKDLMEQVAIILLVGLVSLVLLSALLSMLQDTITHPLTALIEVMRNVIKSGDFSGRATVTSKDEVGELSHVFNQMLDELSRRGKSLQQELGERRSIEAKLSQIAHFDTVTHLPNRHSFNNKIELALLDYKYKFAPFALLYIDLDNFKYVNDTFGHHIGDLLLLRVGERLHGSLRKEDFIARLGGDEFVIIISDYTDISQLNEVAAKLVSVMQPHFVLENREVFVGASIGIAICPEHGKDSEALQRMADTAMYHAKSLGKNNYQHYQQHLSNTRKNRIEVEAQLRRALERKEIAVYFQPIVELASGRIGGFEALVRWIRQDGTITPPDEFIPLSEEIGLILDIGKYVLDTSAAQTAEWVERFGPTFTAVNFSSRQFKSNNLAEDIFKALELARLDPCYLEMEITESVLMDNSLDSLKLMDLVIKKGMRIAIDDFGTGYSSLSYLTSFPVSKIKIDKSFVAKLPDDNNALAVVTAIIGLSNSLNLKVVAEGIETTEQLACLTKLGCGYGQGYLFSKPVPAIEATRLLEARGAPYTPSGSSL